MFNIKLTDNDVDCRTVVLRKADVDIDSRKRLIVMIRDVTDKVKLEQVKIKKEK